MGFVFSLEWNLPHLKSMLYAMFGPNTCFFMSHIDTDQITSELSHDPTHLALYIQGNESYWLLSPKEIIIQLEKSPK